MATSEEALADIPDDALAARCSTRPADEAAWREFWRRFYPWLFRKVARILSPAGSAVPPAEVDDVLQWVMLKVFQALPAFDPQKAPLRAYLTVIATTSVVDQLRRSRAGTTVSLAGMEFVAERLRSGRLEADDLWRQIVQILADMEPRNADLVRGFIEGEAPKELAGRLGVTTSHVHSVVYRFRRRLRQLLDDPSGRPSESRRFPRNGT